MTAARIPQWAHSKDEQKRHLESHLHAFLSHRASNLAPHERYFLAESIAYAGRGLFGLARAALGDAYRDAGLFAACGIDPEMVARASPANLRRALYFLESSPVQMRPVFC